MKDVRLVSLKSERICVFEKDGTMRTFPVREGTIFFPSIWRPNECVIYTQGLPPAYIPLPSRKDVFTLTEAVAADTLEVDRPLWSCENDT